MVHIDSRHHIWIPMIFIYHFDQEVIKILKLVCLENPNSSRYLVWLPQQVSSTFDQIFQGIINIKSSYTYIILHESQRSRELQICKLVQGGWLEKVNWSKLGFPRPYILQFLSYENDYKINLTLCHISNNFRVYIKS